MKTINLLFVILIADWLWLNYKVLLLLINLVFRIIKVKICSDLW